MTVPPPPSTPRSAGLAEALAAEYLDQREAGAEVDLDTWARRLDEPSAQEEFRRLIGDAEAASTFLPRQVGPGVLLGGRYRILREIGSGGMGKVFAALDQHLERHVAVKVLATFTSASFDPEQLFMKESRLLATLQHPNIVAVHEAGRDGDLHFIVMDLVEGRSLVDVLAAVRGALAGPAQAAGASVSGAGQEAPVRAPASGRHLAEAVALPLPEGRTSLIDTHSWWRTAAAVMREIVSTLEAAHARGVIHRDLKPGNIMLRGDATPVLLDFGLSGTLDKQDGLITRGLFGSIAYIAPEQARANAVGIDPRTDTYQLGLVLYELLTLRRAFPDDGLTALLEKISLGNFERPRTLDPAIPAELEAICLRATELQPERRYQTVREFREDLDRYLGGRELPLAARGGPLASWGRRSRYFLRRHRAATLAAASVVIAIGIATWGATAAPEPLLEAYRYDTRDGAAVPASAGDTTHPQERLGVRVQCDEPCFVYALSVFGQRDPPTFVLPMRPEEIHQAEGEKHGWALRVNAGVTDVACTLIDKVTPDIPYEGLWVFAGTSRMPDIETWLENLDRTSRQRYGGAGVPFEVARVLYESGGGGSTTRGADPKLSEAQRRRLAERIETERVFGENTWPYKDPQRFQAFFRVQE